MMERGRTSGAGRSAGGGGAGRDAGVGGGEGARWGCWVSADVSRDRSRSSRSSLMAVVLFWRVLLRISSREEEDGRRSMNGE